MIVLPLLCFMLYEACAVGLSALTFPGKTVGIAISFSADICRKQWRHRAKAIFVATMPISEAVRRLTFAGFSCQKKENFVYCFNNQRVFLDRVVWAASMKEVDERLEFGALCLGGNLP
jgi:hypothetical protein